jgi:hypothetical protein
LHLREENCDPFALPRSGCQLMIVKSLQSRGHAGTSIWQVQEVKPLRKPQREHSSSALHILRPANFPAKSFPIMAVADEAESASAPITTRHDGRLTVFCRMPGTNRQLPVLNPI